MDIKAVLDLSRENEPDAAARARCSKVVPFLVEDELKRLGGRYEKVENWKAFVVSDGRLVTGQNPASSKPGAEALLMLLA